MKKTIPAAPAEEVEEAIQGAEAKLNSLRETEAGAEASQSAREETFGAEFKAEAAKVRRASEAAQAKIRAAAERECAALEKKENADVEALNESAQAKVADGAGTRDAQAAESQAQIEEQTAALATLREQEKRATQDAESRRLADKFEAEAEELKADAGKLSLGIDNLDAARRALASDLPIDGLEVRGKDIFVEGVEFSQVNTAKKIEMAVRIATLRANPELPIIFLDGVEALDEDHFALLVKELEASPCQAFLAKVTAGELAVEAS